MLPLPTARTYEEGLPSKAEIPGFWGSAVPVSGGTREDIVYSSTAQYKPEEPVSVSESCTSTSRYTGRQAREARLWAEAEDEAHRQERQGFKGVSMPSHHRLSQKINQLYRVRSCYLAYGQEYYLILVHRIHLSLYRLC